MKKLHCSNSALLLLTVGFLIIINLCLNIIYVGKATRGSAKKTFQSKRGPQPKKFGNRCPRNILLYDTSYICTALVCVLTPKIISLITNKSSYELYKSHNT